MQLWLLLVVGLTIKGYLHAPWWMMAGSAVSTVCVIIVLDERHQKHKMTRRKVR